MYRLRVKYGKYGVGKYLSHLETIKAIERALRRAEIPFILTSGFSPHLKISFGFPLPVGYLSESEFFDLFLSSPIELKTFLNETEKSFPAGLKVLQAKYVYLKGKSLMSIPCYALYLVKGEVNPPFSLEVLEEKRKKFLSLRKISYFYRGKKKEVNVIEDILSFSVKARGEKIEFQLLLPLGGKRNIRPEILIDSFRDLFFKKTCFKIKEIWRKQVCYKSNDKLEDLLDFRGDERFKGDPHLN